MLYDLEKLISDLNWKNSIELQKMAIENLMKIEDMQVIHLIKPIAKSHWQNAALVIKKIGYPRNRQAIPGLIEWIQDMNWPGAEIAFEILLSIDVSILLPHIEIAIQKAINENDEIWIMAIRELIINKLNLKGSNFKNVELFNKLLSIEG